MITLLGVTRDLKVKPRGQRQRKIPILWRKEVVGNLSLNIYLTLTLMISTTQLRSLLQTQLPLAIPYAPPMHRRDVESLRSSNVVAGLLGALQQQEALVDDQGPSLGNRWRSAMQ